MSNVIKRVQGSINDVRVAFVNGRAVATIRKEGHGYAVDALYGKVESHYGRYAEARDAAFSAPQTI